MAQAKKIVIPKQPFVLYDKGIKYIIEASNQNEARTLFYKLLKEKWETE